MVEDDGTSHKITLSWKSLDEIPNHDQILRIFRNKAMSNSKKNIKKEKGSLRSEKIPFKKKHIYFRKMASDAFEEASIVIGKLKIKAVSYYHKK